MKLLWYSVFLFLFFLFRSNSKKNTWMRMIFFTVMVIILKVTWYQLFSKFSTITRYIDNGIWKTPYSWRFYGHGINILVNSFLGKYQEMKMGEGALEIINYTKIQACSLKNIAPRHCTYYCILLFLWNKPSF